MTKALSIILFIGILMLSSCRKEPSLVDATVIYTGSIMVDGCDWLITIGDKNYKAINLPLQYQVNNLEVKLSYDLLASEDICGWGAKHTKIEINSIKKK